ncbi:uncharacterized protein TNCV_2157621 [Trichonephila clavipes]|nr:uncharacterized protein TNCV_2157621 [Trichonephila clavipes]
MWKTPELAPFLLTTTPQQRKDVSPLDRFSVHRCPTRRVFSGTGLELVTRLATIRYLYHSATAATSFGGSEESIRDVLLHTSVRCLSSGKVLERFFSLREEVMLFLEHNKIYSKLKNDGRWYILVFLCDVAEKLNNLNSGLWDENKIILQMANKKKWGFEEKLNICVMKKFKIKYYTVFQP